MVSSDHELEVTSPGAERFPSEGAMQLGHWETFGSCYTFDDIYIYIYLYFSIYLYVGKTVFNSDCCLKHGKSP